MPLQLYTATTAGGGALVAIGLARSAAETGIVAPTKINSARPVANRVFMKFPRQSRSCATACFRLCALWQKRWHRPAESATPRAENRRLLRQSHSWLIVN